MSPVNTQMHFRAERSARDILIVLVGPDDVVCRFYGTDPCTQEMANVALNALNAVLVAQGHVTRKYIAAVNTGLPL